MHGGEWFDVTKEEAISAVREAMEEKDQPRFETVANSRWVSIDTIRRGGRSGFSCFLDLKVASRVYAVELEVIENWEERVYKRKFKKPEDAFNHVEDIIRAGFSPN